MALEAGSESSMLGFEPSGVDWYTCSSDPDPEPEPELEETSVRPDDPEYEAVELLVEVEPDASEGDDTPESISSGEREGYRGLKRSRSNSNSRMMRFCSVPAVDEEWGSKFAGAVIRGRWAAHQQIQLRRCCGSLEDSSGSALPGSPDP